MTTNGSIRKTQVHPQYIEWPPGETEEKLDDIELREDIGRLRVGDHVHLTFLSGAGLREPLPVRITRIRAAQFLGRLAGQAVQPELLGLTPDVLVAFTSGQIHSIAPRPLVPASGLKERRRR